MPIQYSTLTQIPQSFKMTNRLTSSDDTKHEKSCQSSFTYFNQSKGESILWGSSKPMKEQCNKAHKPHNGVPVHSLWNNMTKRKSLIIKE